MTKIWLISIEGNGEPPDPTDPRPFDPSPVWYGYVYETEDAAKEATEELRGAYRKGIGAFVRGPFVLQEIIPVAGFDTELTKLTVPLPHGMKVTEETWTKGGKPLPKTPPDGFRWTDD